MKELLFTAKGIGVTIAHNVILFYIVVGTWVLWRNVVQPLIPFLKYTFGN